MLLLLSGLALAFSDTLGGDGTAHDDGGMLKLVSISVQEAALVRDLGFAVAGRGVTSEVVAVLYVEVGGAWEIVGQASALEPADGMVGWATASDVDWLLEPGRAYAIGAWVGEGWTYFYDEGRTDDPWFGAVTGSYRVDGGDIPDTFRAEAEDYYYWLRIDSIDADADADGVAAGEHGGLDCDDTDPTVGARTDEIPYDGIDQDCDGADMNDIDHDGVVAWEAGGLDCDDTTGAVAPGNAEVCDDGLDNDCVDGDLSCDEVFEPRPSERGFGPAIDISPDGCGGSTGTATLGGALMLVAVTGRRRRR